MLNGQKLILSPDGELPIISPKVRGTHQLITIPSQCVFFLVLPDSKSKACMAVQVEESKDTYKNGGKVIDQDVMDEIDYETSPLYQEDDSVSSEKNTYVAFRPKYSKTNDESGTVQRNERQEKSKSKNNEMNEQNNNENIKQSEPVVKYVTFSNNNWLSKFPKTLNNQEYSAEPSTFQSPTEVGIVEMQTERSVLPTQSRREKYQILAQAVAGKRYSEKNIRPDLYSNLDSATASLKPMQKLKLIKRSADNSAELSSKESEEIVQQFTNIEKTPLNTLSKTDETPYPDEPPSTDVEHVNVSECPKKKLIPIYAEIPEIQQSAGGTLQTQQAMIVSSTPATTTTCVKPHHHHAKIESHVQKIKSRVEQALAKMNEKSTQKIHGRRSQEKSKENVINPTIEEPRTEKMLTTCTTENITTKNEPTVTTNNLADKIRYNRQANNTTTDGNLKIVRPRISLKSKKLVNNVDIDNIQNAVSSQTPKITRFERSTTDMPSNTTTKSINVPKLLKLARPKLLSDMENVKILTREIRETTQHPTPKLKIKPVLPTLRSVKTPHDVDGDQMVANEKITEKLVENYLEGKKTLKSEHIVSSPIIDNDGGDGKLESRASLADAKLRALEAKIKTRRSEMERRLHERIHKVNKRSPTNDLIVDDAAGVNDILTNGSGPNDIDIDILPVLKRETIRRPRSMVDFKVKLNEVNTYVDKNKKATNPMNNEISDVSDDDGVGLKDWKNTNDFRLSAEDDGFDKLNIKLKRKSVFEDMDDDEYSKLTVNMINKVFGHMHTFWKYIRKTFQF